MITCAHVCFLQCRIWAVLTGWLCLPCICGCWFSSPDHIKKNVSSFPSTLSSASVEQLPSLPSRCVTFSSAVFTCTHIHVQWDWPSLFYSLQKCYHFLFQRYRLEHYTVSSNWLALSAVVVFAVLSLSRSVALFRGVWPQFSFFPLESQKKKKKIHLENNFSLKPCPQVTTLLWIYIQSFTALPKIQLFTRSLKADQSMYVWEKSGIASRAASCCQTSQYPRCILPLWTGGLYKIRTELL